MKSFMEIGPHVFPKSGTHIHRQTEAVAYIPYQWANDYWRALWDIHSM